MNLAALAQAPTRFSLDHAGVAGKWMEDSHGFFRVGPEGRDRQRFPQESLYVAVVADGSATDGSLANATLANGAANHLAGSNASYLAVQTVERVMQQQPSAMPVLQRMGEAIRATHQTILEASAVNASLRGTSTSLIMAVVDGWRLYVSHVGNSRAYLIRNKVAHRLTVDHLPVQAVLGEQHPAESEYPADDGGAQQIPLRFGNGATNLQIDHAILVPTGDPNRDLESEKRPTNTSLQLQAGDIVLLCSDGLTEKLSDQELGEVFSQQKPKQAVRQLVNKALEYRAEDNVTAAVLVLPKIGENRWLSPRNIDMGALFVSALLAFLLLAIAVWSGVAINRGIASATNPSVAVSAVASETPAAISKRVIPAIIASTATPLATSSPANTLTPTLTTSPTPTPQATATPLATATGLVVVAASDKASVLAASKIDEPQAVAQTTPLAQSSKVEPSVVLSATRRQTATVATTATSATRPTTEPTTSHLPVPAPIQPILPVPIASKPSLGVFTTTQIAALEIALTESPTATPLASNSVASAPVQPDLASFAITLMEPMESTLLGNTLFRWQPNFELPAKYAFELIFWQAGGDPLQSGFSPIGVNQSTNTRVDLNMAAFGSLQGMLLPERNYEWSVALVDASQPEHRLKTLAPGQGFMFKIDESSQQPAAPVAQPTDTPLPPPPTHTPVPPPPNTPEPPATDTPLPPPTETPVPPPTDTPVPPATDTPVPLPTEDCPRIDPNCGS